MFNNKNLFKQIPSFELGLHLSFYVLLTLIAGSFILALWFLYQRFYLTLTQTEDIIILKSQLAVEDLNITSYNKIKNNLNLRDQIPPHKWENVQNPFIKPTP